jgi:enoyl-CoA hydratase/carnithine racemase
VQPIHEIDRVRDSIAPVREWDSAMPYQFASYETRGRIAYVTINRPEVLNAIHGMASQELAAIWDEFEADDTVWVAILTGAGDRAFSAGNDLKATAAGTGRATGPFNGGFGGLVERWEMVKPVIAAVNGWAMGGGFEIALACDIIVASERARFALPEPRVGLYAGGAGIHRLPRQIPQKLAMGMLLTGRHIDAHTAERYGLVNEVVPHDELMAAAERWAGEILDCAPLSVRGSKQAALGGLGRPLHEAYEAEYDQLQRHRASADYIEGPRAFSEKRPPHWTGA